MKSICNSKIYLKTVIQLQTSSHLQHKNQERWSFFRGSFNLIWYKLGIPNAIYTSK